MRSPKYRKSLKALTVSAGFSIPFVSAVSASDIFKANNTADLNTAASWEGGAVSIPTNQEVAVFDSRITTPSSLFNLGASTTWGGLKVVNNVNELVIADLTFTTTLNFGLGGVDMSGATSGNTFAVFGPTVSLVAGRSQNWSVADGATFYVAGTPTRPAGSTVNFDLGATGTGKIRWGAMWGGATASSILSNTTVNKNDFAALVSESFSLMGEAQTTAVVVVPAATLSLSQPNPSDGGVVPAVAAVQSDLSLPVAGHYIDVTNSNGLAAATAFQFAATCYFDANTGIRFNQPHATAATDWVVGYTNGGRIQPGGPFSILVTPNVGARNVVFSRAGGGHEFRFNSSGTQLLVQQNNTAGDLIWRGDISATNMNAAQTFTKSGPGRVIMANPTYGQTSSSVYIAEGVLQLGENSATGTFGDRPINNSGTLRLQRNDAFNFANPLSGAGAVVIAMSGAGEASFNGANTYTGATTLESGGLVLGSATALGATSSLTLQGGSVIFGSGITTDLTASPLSLTGPVTFNTNGNNVVFANSIGAGAGGINKAGAGTLTLAGSNAYTGSTSVNSGVLAVTNGSGSATGSGAVAVTSGATLTGSGRIAGTVTVANGGVIQPGNSGVGTLNVGGLALQAGSQLTMDVASTSSNDRVNVTGSNGLTIDGGVLAFYNAGTSTGLTTPGVYNLFQYTGGINGAGVSALSIQNPQAGYKYVFGTSAGNVTLTVTAFGMITTWTANGSGSFSDSTKWSAGVPTGDGATANFTTALSGPATVTLDGNRTLGGITFDSANGYTIAQGSSGTLYIDNAGSAAAINVLNGSHVVSASVGLVGDLLVTTSPNASLTFSGAVAGTGNITKSGAGSLTFSNTNLITGNTVVTGGILEFGSLASIGNGAITLNGGTLRYGAGNTADISSRVVTIGTDGGTIDINGNNVTFAAPIGNSGLGSFTKKGAGSLTLAAGNTYAGATVIQGGKIVLGANNQLNALGVGVTLDGGTLSTTATFDTDRVLTIAAAGGGVEVASGTTLTALPALAGSGLLTKSGAGTLLLPTASGRAGGLTISAGSVTVRGATIGSGAVTLANGTLLAMEDTNGPASGGSSTFTGNAITVAADSSVSMQSNSAGNGYSGAVTGDANSTFNIVGTSQVAAAAQVSFSGGGNVQQFANFFGTVNIPTGASLRFSSTSGLNNGGANTTFNIGGNLTARNNGTVNVGALIGTGSISGSNGANNNTTNFSIGGKNVDTTFQGVIVDADVVNGRRAAVIKTGTAVLTLTGASTYTGATTVNAGVLRIDGSLGATATTVAATGILAGRGTIGGATTVNGILQPAANVANAVATNGQLTFSSTLTLGAASTTNIDFSGVLFTGVKSTLTNGVTYGGTLKLNFPGTVFNGSYTLFELTGVPAGAFSAVTVTTANAANVALNNNSGTWSGTDGVAAPSFSFNSATGVLTVTNAASALTPGASTLSATAGNAKVDLSWTAATDAGTYTVKRATTAGGPYTDVQTGVAGLAFSDTTVTNGTTYYYVVAAKNTASGLTGPNSNEVSATPIAAPVHTAFETWRFDQFGVYTDTGSVLAGDLEDYDGDGLVNLQEYALGTNPKVANASPVVVGRNGDKLTLTYPRIADAKLTYTVQGVNDLAGSPVWATVDTKTGNAAGSTVVEDTALLSANPRRFLRLSVTYTP